MESTGCSKELTPPTLVAANDSTHGDNAESHSIALPPLSALDPMLVPPGAVEGLLTRTAPHSSPPLDRIVALCHFVI